MRIILVSLMILAFIRGTFAAMPEPEQSVFLAEPLRVEQCVELALRSHPTLRAAQAERDSAQAGIAISEALTRPQVAVSGGYYAADSAARDGVVTSLRVKHLLFDSGRTSAQIHEAEATEAMAAQEYQRITQSVVFGARQAYYAVLAAEQAQVASEEASQFAALQVRVARARYNEGLVPKIDVTRAEVGLAQADLDLIRARNAVRLTYADLNRALGLPLDTAVRVAGTLEIPGEHPDLAALLEYAYRHRPELARADAQIAAARARLTVAKSGTQPAVSASAGYDWQDSGSTNGTGWTIGLEASLALWDGGGTRARIAQAIAGLDATQASSANLKEEVGLEVTQAYLSIMEAEQRVTTAAMLVTSAEENHRLASGRYEAGLGPMLDAVEANTALTAARTSYVQARYDTQVARARLDKAVGREFAMGATFNEP